MTFEGIMELSPANKSNYDALKAAIKGGREYDERQIEALVKELLATPNVTVCPHGRPVAMRMTKAAIDRNFDRI